jgi:hypothetical protein
MRRQMAEKKQASEEAVTTSARFKNETCCGPGRLSEVDSSVWRNLVQLPEAQEGMRKLGPRFRRTTQFDQIPEEALTRQERRAVFQKYKKGTDWRAHQAACETGRNGLPGIRAIPVEGSERRGAGGNSPGAGSERILAVPRRQVDTGKKYPCRSAGIGLQA